MNRKIKEKRSAVDLIRRIATEIEGVTPAKQTMIADLKMMNFKIRPLSGDLFSLSTTPDMAFLLSLWRIGKIEEIVKTALQTLDDIEMESFFDYLEWLEERLQHHPQNVQASLTDNTKSQLVKLEVFRDQEKEKLLVN